MEDSSALKRSHEAISTAQRQFLVPANGNCFFISVILSYLLTVIHDPETFNQRLAKIFDFTDEQKNLFRENLFQSYQDLNYLNGNPVFTEVITQLKARLEIRDWGGNSEDIQKTERFLGIKIVELVEHEIFDDKAKDDLDIPRVFILRCAPNAKEVSSPQDDLSLKKAKLASAHLSGEQRHFRVIDYNDAIDDSFMCNVANKTEHSMKKIPRDETCAIEKAVEALIELPTTFDQTLFEFAQILDKQLCKYTHDIKAINWEELNAHLRTSFTERLNYVTTFLKETLTDTPNDDEPERDDEADFSDRHYAEHSQLVFQGALFALDGKFEEAFEALHRATTMPHFKLHKLPHLWMLDIYFRQKKFAKIIEHIKSNELLESDPQIKCIGALYPYFTQWGPTIIQQHFLNFTHVFYPQSEFEYFYAMAKKALCEDASNAMPIYMQRADSCLLTLHYDEAIENYDRALEEPEALFRKAFALMISGRFKQAGPCFEQAIKKQKDLDYKLYYLTFYIDICWKIGETGFARSFREDVLSLELDDASLITRLKFSLINLKILLSDKNPRFERVLKEMTDFVERFMKLSFEDKDTFRFINEFFDVAKRSVTVYARSQQIENCKAIIAFMLETYNKLMFQIHAYAIIPKDKDGKKIEGRKLYFPNWCFDRIYINYQTALLEFYAKLYINAQINRALLENLEIAVKNIPVQFNPYHIRTGYCLTGNAGNDIDILLFLANFYTRFIPFFEQVHDQLRTHFPSVSVMEEMPDTPEENTPIEFDLATTTFNDYLRWACSRTEKLMRRTVLWKSFYQHLEFVRDVFFKNTSSLLKLRLSNFTLKLTEEPTDHENMEKYCTVLCGDLDAYHHFLTDELSDTLLIYIFRKNLKQYYASILIPSLKNLLNVCSEIPHNARKNLLDLVNQLLSKIINFIEACKSDVHPLKKLSLLTSECQREYQKQRSAMETAQLERKLKQVTNSFKRDTLDVDYGKSPFVVPFPRQAITSRLSDYIQKQGINAKRNISAHFLTVVYSEETYARGNQHTKCHVHIPIDVFNDNDDVVGSEKSQGPQDILFRIQQGWDAAQNAKDMRYLCANGNPSSFEPAKHSHSEQNCFSYLSKNIYEIANAITKEIPPGSKVYMVSFDLGSIRTSCHCCRLSAVAMQAVQKGFIANLQAILKEKGFEIAGNKSEEGCKLKATTRILAQNNNGIPDDIPHQNPNQKNIKYLNNLGIFQSQESTVFISGKAENARKPDLVPQNFTSK